MCTETRGQFRNLALQIPDGLGVSLQTLMHSLGALLLHGDRYQAMLVIQRKRSRGVGTRDVKAFPLLRWCGGGGRQRRADGILARGA